MANVISLYQGEYKVFECSITEDSVALILTGASIYFAVYRALPPSSYADDSNAFIAKSTGSGITITNGASGMFEIEFKKLDTNNLHPGQYNYGIEAILSGYTDPVVLDVGTIEILASYVRAV